MGAIEEVENLIYEKRSSWTHLCVQSPKV